MGKNIAEGKVLPRVRFAQHLNENIKNKSRLLGYVGGNVTMAVINYDFAYELTDIFNETITDFLVEGYSVGFDQFGKFEVKTQPKKRMKNIFTGGKEVILPELKMIRFYPALRLKQRIRGEVTSKAPRGFKFKPINKKENLIEGEENEIGD